MSTHTPGPWEVGFRAMDVVASRAPKGPMKVCDIRGWGYLTGKGHGALGLPEEEAVTIQEANARLIAAAPDLLEALKQFADKMDRACLVERDHSHSDLADALRDALSAIAKAEGN